MTDNHETRNPDLHDKLTGAPEHGARWGGQWQADEIAKAPRYSGLRDGDMADPWAKERRARNRLMAWIFYTCVLAAAVSVVAQIMGWGL